METIPQNEYLDKLAAQLKSDFESKEIDEKLFFGDTKKEVWLRRYARYKLISKFLPDLTYEEKIRYSIPDIGINEFARFIETHSTLTFDEATFDVENSSYLAAIWPERVY